MKKSFLLVASLLLSALFLQSCIEISEKLSVLRDGSGSYELTIDMSEMKEMIDAMGGMDENAESPLAEMEKNYTPIMEELKTLEGISNVEVITDESTYIITTRFDFASQEALNNGMVIVLEDSTDADQVDSYYILRRRAFIRTPEHNILIQLKEALSSEMQNQEMDMGQLFSDVTYVNEIEFPDRKVRRTTSDDVVIKEDKTGASIEKYIFREGEDLDLEYKIKLRRRW